jgi:lipoprotein-releasing system permease protein
MIGFLSARILLSLRKNSYLLFFITLSFLGMAIGTASLLLIMAFMNGAQDMIRKRFLATTPHLLVQPASGSTLEDSPGTVERLRKLEGVTRAERRLVLPALSGVWFGEIAGMDGASTVRIPFGKPAERVHLLLPVLTLTPAGLVPSGLTLAKESDGGSSDRIDVPLARLQEALGLQGRVSAYALFLDDPERAAGLEGELQRLFGPRARVSTFARLNAPLFLALALEKWLMFAGVGLVLLVSFLQLYQSFSLLVLHHEVTWATLQALGASRSSIAGIFSAVALGISLAGGGAGFLVALVLGHLQNSRHILPFPQSLAHLGHVPLVLDAGLMFQVAALLALFSLAVALPTARKAMALSVPQVMYAPE